jgi:hypothetical protein
VPFGYWHVFAEWIVQYYVEGAQQGREMKLQEQILQSSQLGYTSIEAFKCSSILQLHYGHGILFNEYYPTAPDNPSGH